MPIIHAHFLEGRTLETRRKYAAELTRITSEILNVPAQRVHIVLTEVPAEGFAHGGILMSDSTVSKDAKP
ncbi:MAG TPA: tautomerase family protein [Opitutales bacterium]|nr:tautomerase family protein [Opitutales bacterium]